MSAASSQPIDTLAQLQAELATRQSVLHFAHCAVAVILALIAAGTAGKMTWDFGIRPEVDVFIPAVGVFSGLCFLYGLVRYLFGRRALKKELVSFAQLQALRRQLGLDDPSGLLPPASAMR